MAKDSSRKKAKSSRRTRTKAKGNAPFQPRERVAKLLEGQQHAEDVLAIIDELVNERDALAAEHERQKLRIKQLVHLAYGRKSEKLSHEEMHQLALEFGATEQQAAKEEPDVPVPDAPEQGDEAEQGAADKPKGKGSKDKRGRKRRNRTVIGAEVERIVHDVSVSPQERTCVCCRREMDVIGHVEHETVEFVPAKIMVHVERREKLACRKSDCRKDIHTAARAQDSPNRRKVGVSLLAHMVEAKCDDALPIDRQRDQFERMGVSFPPNTLYSHWTYVTTLFAPVAEVTCARVLASDIVGLDDTKLRVLDPTRAGGSYKGCLWCFTSGTGPLVAYTFTETWEAEAIAPYIGAITGFIQCDDYKGYSSVVKMPDGSERVLVDPERRLGCSMHLRRRFYEAYRLGDKRASRAIDLIHDLYQVETDAKERGLGPDDRLDLRTRTSVPLMKQFDAWVDETKPRCTPKSPLGRAVGYAGHQRPFIHRCLSDGRFEIDNGHTERTLRKPCIGRNNYLFTGSPEAARRLAGAYTLGQSCRNVGVPFRDYLLDVIPKLEGGWPLRRIGELVPDVWARLHGPLAERDKAAE